MSPILYVETKPTAPYCDCHFPNCVEILQHLGPVSELCKCRCGEENSYRKSWHWQENLSNDTELHGHNVVFHPTFSQGTAIIRGNKPLESGMIHFWEMRVLTALSGTDLICGIGTDKVDVNEYRFQFVGALGLNSQSWGFSYNGEIHHNGKRATYGSKFSQGCILGVLLDRCRGTLKFYLNRRSLGVAFTDIPVDPNVNIYPMVCSTAAKSCIRLMNATSVPQTLQYLSYKSLVHEPKSLAELKLMPGLRSIMDKYWFLTPPVRYSQRSAENEYDIADEAVLSKQSLSRKQKFKDEPTDLTDLYANAHKVVVRRPHHEERLSMNELIDEYFHYLF